MRAREFLKEYNVAKTAEHFGSKLLDAAAMDISHEVKNIRYSLEADKKLTPEQEQQLITALLKLLENVDPTPNKKYMVWIAKMYAGAGYQSNYEDMASTVRENLAKFDKLNIKRMITAPNNDIMRYKTIDDFLKVVEQMPDPFEDGQQEVNKGTAKEFYNDNQIRVIIPEDMNAACYYGQGTRWCTAAKNNNMFKHYVGRGSLYIIIPKNPSYAGEKYQFHFADEQYMDQLDKEINLEKLVDKYPSLTKAFAQQAQHYHVTQLMTLEQQQEHRKLAEQYLFQIGKQDKDLLMVNISSDTNTNGLSWYRTKMVEAFTGRDLYYGDWSSDGAVGVVVIDLRKPTVPVIVTSFGNEYDVGTAIGNDLAGAADKLTYASDEQYNQVAKLDAQLNSLLHSAEEDQREFRKGIYYFYQEYGEPEDHSK